MHRSKYCRITKKFRISSSPKDILKMYKELGGEITTIGSDAHLPEHIGYKFEDIPKILKSIGFNYYTVFENQNPKFYSL